MVLNRLQEIVGNDAEMYQSMSRLLFLDPKRITTSLEDVLNQAAMFESAGNMLRAELWYRIAGGIALYRGDAASVRKFFEKAAQSSRNSKPEYQTLTNRSEVAVSIAKKYYEMV